MHFVAREQGTHRCDIHVKKDKTEAMGSCNFELKRRLQVNKVDQQSTMAIRCDGIT